MHTDAGNGMVHKVVFSTGETTTVSKDWKFSLPSGITIVDNGARAVVSDSVDHMLYTVDIQKGQVKHLSGKTMMCSQSSRSGNGCAQTSEAFEDGTSSNTHFNSPSGIAYEAGRNSVVVCDELNHALRRVQLSDGSSTTIAGRNDNCISWCNVAIGSYSEGVGRNAGFNRPSSIAIMPDGTRAVVASTMHSGTSHSKKFNSTIH
jgi:DNA-binding beta-propeller fold protein YncE